MRLLLFFTMLIGAIACTSEKIVYRDLPPVLYCPPERRWEVLIPTEKHGVFTTTGTISLCYGTPFYVTGEWVMTFVFVDGKQMPALKKPISERIVTMDDGTYAHASGFCFFETPPGRETFAVELASYTNDACTMPHYHVVFRAVCTEPQHKSIPPCK